MAYEKNDNFQEAVSFVSDQGVPNWPTANCGFKQLIPKVQTEILQKFTKAHIDHYFVLAIAQDKELQLNKKAIEKGQKLLESNRVKACSYVIIEDKIFFSGIISAAMKKNVAYNFKLCFKNHCEPIHSHCECPAGVGPKGTCKHIAAVLLCLYKFAIEGELLVGKACTEELQTFHHPAKKHKGSPLKAEQMGKRRNDFDDPRPLKFRNRPGYNDRVQNLITNFAFQSEIDICARYAYKKADLQTASNDHDYCKLPFLEYWVDRGNFVTESEAENLQKETVDQRTSNLWFDARQWRVTASHFGDILHATDRRNMLKLAENIFSQNPIHSAPVLHGNKYERVAIEWYEKKYKVKVKKCGLFVHTDFPYLGASPDGLLNEDIIIEVKCPYTGREEKIQPNTSFPFLTYDNKGELQLKTSHKYYAQVQGQMYIADKKLCKFLVYTLVDEKVIDIQRDNDFCKKKLLPALKHFYINVYRKYVANCL